MSQSEKVSWSLPTVAANQATIAYVAVQLAVAGLSPTFTDFSHVTADQPQTETLTELEPGDYIVRLTVFDTQKPPKSSSPVDTSFTVAVPVPPVIEAPGSVSNVSVTPA